MSNLLSNFFLTVAGLSLAVELAATPAASATALQAGTTKTRISHSAYVAHRSTYHTAYHKQSFGQRHPKIKSAAIGAGVGAAGGAVLGAITHHGIGRGMLIGAGAGAGTGLIRSSNTLKRHPILRDSATGAAIGLGIGGAAGRGGKAALVGTGIGAAGGLGFGALKHGGF